MNYARKYIYFIMVAVSICSLVACSSGGATVSTYTATSGVAQKGPLLKGSTVTVQELDASLSPTGKQYSYQVDSDLGTFSPTSTFSSQYIGLNATGYYFDEVANSISAGPITLNGISDLSTDTVLNVNLLTTLAYQRIINLATTSHMTFPTATSQAENEVLAALNIQNGNSYGSFGSLDITKGRDGDNILVAISSIFVYGNTSGTLSSLIADFQSDIANNGVIDSAATNNSLIAAAKSVNPALVASNLTEKYASIGVSFTATDIGNWIDQISGTVTTKTWLSAGNLATARSNHTATLLLNGMVLVAGGYNPGNLASAELYNPATNTWTAAGSLATARSDHTATLLPNGIVLVSGGFSDSVLASAELYDPATNTWSAAGSLATARYSHRATLLPNGMVLVTGGFIPGSNLASAELYDPATNTWTAAGSLATARSSHTATLLPNGMVLVAGGGNFSGNLASAELYDPATNTWTAAGSLATARRSHTATLLPNGIVLMSGGFNDSVLASAELYDPATNTWSAAESLATARFIHTATLLPNGMVLVVGGNGGGFNGSFASAELYDPAMNKWSAVENLAISRHEHTATLLSNGIVLVAGGYTGVYAVNGANGFLKSAEYR